ncbi:hypothetical protein ES705_39733 [subsurface metagenome]
MVIIFFSVEFNKFSVVYSVVDFPLPVGPVTKIIPLGFFINDKKSGRISGEKPKESNSNKMLEGSNILKTALSPVTAGNIETLILIFLPPTFT